MSSHGRSSQRGVPNKVASPVQHRVFHRVDGPAVYALVQTNSRPLARCRPVSLFVQEPTKISLIQAKLASGYLIKCVPVIDVEEVFADRAESYFSIHTVWKTEQKR